MGSLGKAALSRWALPAAATVLVLVPYATLALPFATALYVQAGCILAVVGALLGLGLTSHGAAEVSGRLRDLLGAGLVLYSLAAVLGMGVALWRGNGLRDLMGQALSMGLIPLAALAGAGAPAALRRRFLVTSLVGATTVVCWIHLGDGLFSLAQGRPPGRMILANGVTAAGPVLIALPLALALALHPRRPLGRGAAWFAVATLLSYAAGSGIRSLWLVLPIAVAGFLVFSGYWRRAVNPWFLGVASLVLAALAGSVVGGHRWIESGGATVLGLPPGGKAVSGEGLEDGDPRREPREEPASFGPGREVASGEWYRLTACLGHEGSGERMVRAVWLDGKGASLAALALELVPPDEGTSCAYELGVAPDGAVTAEIEAVPAAARGAWRGASASLARLGTGPWVPLAIQAHTLVERLEALLDVIRGGTRDDHSTQTIRFRFHETSRLWELFRQGGLPEKLLGHGLGARYRLDVHGWDNRGNWIYYGDVNYVHNFFAFLLYKLGLLGGALVLAALAIWIVWGARRARFVESAADRALIAATTAALVAATVWSLSSPVFLNFRLAPIWGLLLVSMRPRSGPSARGQG